jgi:WD40 repeat protein
MVTIVSAEQFDNSEEPPPHARPMTLQREIPRPGLVLSLDWSPDGSMLAVGGSDKRCTIFDDTWQIVSEVQGNASVASVKWNPAGNQVAIGCSDGTVAVVNINKSSMPGETVHGAAMAASQKKDGTRTVFSYSNTGGPAKVNTLCWSPDGHFLAIGGSDHCCAIIETETFFLVHEIRRSGSVTSVAWNQRRLLTGDEGRYLVIGSEDRSVAIMKTGAMREGGDSISRTASDISDASSSYFSIGSLSQHEWILKEDSFLDIEDDDSFSPNGPPSSPLDSARADSVITAVSFSRHKKKMPSLYIAFASSNGTVTIKSTKDWRTVQVRKQVESILMSLSPAFPLILCSFAHLQQMSFSKMIRAVHFSRRSDFMALGGEGAIVYVVSVSDWRIVKEVRVTSSSIHALRFSRSDERLAVGCSDGVLALLSLEDDWEVTGEIDTSESSISCIDWSFRHLAVGRTDGNVDIYEAARVYANFFLPKAELTRRDGPVYSVAFGVSGQFLGKYVNCFSTNRFFFPSNVIL